MRAEALFTSASFAIYKLNNSFFLRPKPNWILIQFSYQFHFAICLWWFLRPTVAAAVHEECDKRFFPPRIRTEREKKLVQSIDEKYIIINNDSVCFDRRCLLDGEMKVLNMKGQRKKIGKNWYLLRFLFLCFLSFFCLHRFSEDIFNFDSDPSRKKVSSLGEFNIKFFHYICLFRFRDGEKKCEQEAEVIIIA